MVKAQEGSKLVFAHVAFYHELAAGSVGEVPNEVADRAIAAGWAEEVDSLDARVKAHGGRVATASEVYPQGTSGPETLAENLQEDQGVDKPYTEATREDPSGARQLADVPSEKDKVASASKTDTPHAVKVDNERHKPARKAPAKKAAAKKS